MCTGFEADPGLTRETGLKSVYVGPPIGEAIGFKITTTQLLLPSQTRHAMYAKEKRLQIKPLFVSFEDGMKRGGWKEKQPTKMDPQSHKQNN